MSETKRPRLSLSILCLIFLVAGYVDESTRPSAAIEEARERVEVVEIVEAPFTCYEDEAIVRVVAQWDTGGSDQFINRGEIVGALACVPVDDITETIEKREGN